MGNWRWSDDFWEGVELITHFREESPPLPVAELEVGSTIPLDHLHGCQLLLPLGEGPGESGAGICQVLPSWFMASFSV